MARYINWDEELSDEDRAWAEQRLDVSSGKDGLTIGQQIEKNDEKFGKKEKEAAKSRAERMDDLRRTIADAENELSRLQLEEQQEQNQNVMRTGNAAVGLDIVDRTPVNEEKPEGAEDAKETYTGQQWSADRLRAEIDKRNKEREAEDLEPLSKAGTKAELAERLQRDDEEIED